MKGSNTSFPVAPLSAYTPAGLRHRRVSASIGFSIIGRVLLVIIFLFLISPALTHAQTRGKVEEIKDPRIDTLMLRRLQPEGPKPTPAIVNGGATTANNNNNNNITTDGFRVQIFSGSNRADAYNAQAKFKQRYPDLRTYIIYREPDFKVRAGDFRTRLEATKMQQELKPLFPSLFIISEKINPPAQ